MSYFCNTSCNKCITWLLGSSEHEQQQQQSHCFPTLLALSYLKPCNYLRLPIWGVPICQEIVWQRVLATRHFSRFLFLFQASQNRKPELNEYRYLWCYKDNPPPKQLLGVVRPIKTNRLELTIRLRVSFEPHYVQLDALCPVHNWC